MMIKLNIAPSRFIRWQFAIVALLCVLSILSHVFILVTGHGRMWGFIRLLDIGREQSIPTYFASLNLLLASILLLILHKDERASGRRGARYWLALSILFFYFSFDEYGSVHENFGHLRDVFVRHGVIPPWVETHRWLPIGLLFVVVTGVVLVPFLRLLPKRLSRCFLLSGAIFVSGAVGFEFAGAYVLEHGYAESFKDPVYLVTQTLEEGLELSGIALLNCLLYREITDRKLSLVVNGS